MTEDRPEPAAAPRAEPHWIVTAGAVLALFALNAYIAARLFTIEYTVQLGSIEAAFISISRHIMDHGLHLDWYRQWYGGIPFQNTYPPLLHALAAWTASLFDWSPARGHHAVTALFYCLGPVGVFFLAKRFSGDWKLAFAGGAAYSLLYPSSILVGAVRSWSPSLTDPTRLFAIVKFGDSPHAVSAALLPFAMLAVDRAVHEFKRGQVIRAVVACVAVVLTNWLGAAGLAFSCICYGLAAAHHYGWKRTIGRLAAIAALGYAVASPWIPPSTIGRIRYNAQFTVGNYPITPMHALYALAIAAVLVPLVWLLRRGHASILTGWSLTLGAVMSIIVLAADRLDISLMPQPLRYHHEMDLALVLLTMCAMRSLFGLLPVAAPRGILLALSLAGLMLATTPSARRAARQELQPADMSAAIESQIPQWLHEHLPQERVFVTGSTQFWLNAFTETSQLGGGFDQGIVNPQIPGLTFGLPFTENNGPDSAMWLRLYGASAVVVQQEGSRDAYAGAWRTPHKFDGVLPELYRNGGDVIYGVPRRSASLAHVIRPEDVVTRPPVNNLDYEPVRLLAAALENPDLPPATLEWSSNSSAYIRTRMSPQQLLFVQITYHPGWRAMVNGVERPLRADGLGLMLVETSCDGDCEVTLLYDGGIEMKAALLLCLAAGLLLLWPYISSRTIV